MVSQLPTATMDQFISALNSGDVDVALALYDSEAVFAFEKGKLACGVSEIRAAMENFAATQPKLTIVARECIDAGDVSLVCTSWTLENKGPDGMKVKQTGKGAVVLRRASDGTWRIAIENPWADG